MTLLVKIKGKTYSDEALHVCASVENDIGTHIGSYRLDLPEDADDNTIREKILQMYKPATSD